MKLGKDHSYVFNSNVYVDWFRSYVNEHEDVRFYLLTLVFDRYRHHYRTDKAECKFISRDDVLSGCTRALSEEEAFLLYERDIQKFYTLVISFLLDRKHASHPTCQPLMLGWFDKPAPKKRKGKQSDASAARKSGEPFPHAHLIVAVPHCENPTRSGVTLSESFEHLSSNGTLSRLWGKANREHDVDVRPFPDQDAWAVASYIAKTARREDAVADHAIVLPWRSPRRAGDAPERIVNRATRSSLHSDANLRRLGVLRDPEPRRKRRRGSGGRGRRPLPLESPALPARA